MKFNKSVILLKQDHHTFYTRHMQRCCYTNFQIRLFLKYRHIFLKDKATFKDLMDKKV